MSKQGKGVVAVTGASGYIGSFVTTALRDAGYTVRACVRDPKNVEKVGHLQGLSGVELFAADLFAEGSYAKAFDGADAVIHCAAVVEIAKVQDAQREVVDPSVKGVRNVLACLSPSVRTFVHTSSIAAVHQRNRQGNVLTEADWNEWATLANDPYGFAKTQAEKVVWDWAQKNGGRVAVRVINPTVVLGPVQCKLHTKVRVCCFCFSQLTILQSSTVFCREAVYGNKVPPMLASYVDVRDVALAHVRALELPREADGGVQRFIVNSDSPAFRTDKIGAIAQQQLPQYVLRTPPRYPAWLVWILLILSYIFGSLVLSPLERSALTWREQVSNKKAKQVLGIRFRPIEETIKDGVASVIDGGYAKPKTRR
jgi:nucleoside-diphosphate-sugar epimerase